MGYQGIFEILMITLISRKIIKGGGGYSSDAGTGGAGGATGPPNIFQII